MTQNPLTARALTPLEAAPVWRREPYRIFFPLGTLLAWVLRSAARPTARALAAAALLAVVVLAGREVRRRIHVWSDPRALWTEAVTRAPGSARAWNNLGLVLLEQEPRAATAALRRAVALSPADPQLLSTLLLMESLCPTDGPCR